MIDLNLLRKDPLRISALIKKKDPQFPIEQLIEYDSYYRALNHEVELLRSEKNELARQASQGITPELRERSIILGKNLKEKEQKLKELFAQFHDLYLHCPNLIMDDVPAGGKEANKVIKIVGEKPFYDFPLKSHEELGIQLGWFDFHAAALLAGNNFALYKNEAVKLLYSLSLFMLNNNMKHGFMPVLPPYLITEKALENAGNFPRFKDEVYAVNDDKLYLIPTSEVSLTNIYQDKIFLLQDLPIHMTSLTSCFRREAGGYGATERGLIRIHQFEKVEIYTICAPEDSAKEQERMLACAEDILQKLNLHYQISLLAAQDTSFQSAQTYDIEVWLPKRKEYKEVSSVSNCTDFQARRAEIRYRNEAGDKTHHVHTLNGSSLALPRLMVALMETYQKDDGTIDLPDILKMPFLSME